MKRRLLCWMCCVSLSLAVSSVLAEPPAKKTAAKPAKKTVKPPPAPRKPDDAVTPAVKNPERHVKFLARIKEGPVGLLFLGDSITDAWPRAGKESWARFAPYQPADFGISGDRTEHVLWRITNGELEGIAPKVVVIMIGTNNVGHFPDEKPQWVAAGVKQILAIVHAKLPQAKVLLLAVFPRDRQGSPMRKRVEQINGLIAPFADGKQTVFLDIGKRFLDEQGELPSDIMPDKLHPNAKGYEIWYAAMQPTLEKMLKE